MKLVDSKNPQLHLLVGRYIKERISGLRNESSKTKRTGLGQLRLLEVDNRVVVPAKTHLRMIVTPADVPHSWAVPSSGVKCDAVPGRLNQTPILVQREGVYYGQCSIPENLGSILKSPSPSIEQLNFKFFGARARDSYFFGLEIQTPEIRQWASHLLIHFRKRNPSPYQLDLIAPGNKHA